MSGNLSRQDRLDRFRNLLKDASSNDERRRLTQLYNFLTAELAIHEHTTPPPAASAPDRPPSSSQTLELRELYYTDMITTASDEETDADTPMERFQLITEEHATEIIASAHTNSNDIGCHTSNLAPKHRNGYCSRNLRTTRTRLTGSKELIGFQPYLHQLCLVAVGRRNDLKLATQHSGYQLSHLCHTGGCFNPDHIAVESSEHNKARNSCQGQWLVKYHDMTWDPCTHARRGIRKKCILPIHHITTPGYHLNPNSR